MAGPTALIGMAASSMCHPSASEEVRAVQNSLHGQQNLPDLCFESECR